MAKAAKKTVKTSKTKTVKNSAAHAKNKAKASAGKSISSSVKKAVPAQKSAKTPVKSKVVALRDTKAAGKRGGAPAQSASKLKTQKPASRPEKEKSPYKVGNYVVYPTHGVGRIMAEETHAIGDVDLRMLVIAFEKDKMTLRVPLHRASAAGLRPVCTSDHMKKVFNTLKSRAKIARGMWSRRAQEYEGKINSGNILLIAEVVRDLHQNVDQSERSYSERMIYESALNRLVGELAATDGLDPKAALDKLLKLLRAKVSAQAVATEEVREAA